MTKLNMNKQKIYIVCGQTGEYEDYVLWHVRAFLNKEDANKLKNDCTKDAKRWEKERTYKFEGPRRGWSKNDPKMRMVYHGTTYYVQSVYLG